jgi:hypothetical protein
MTGSTQAMTTGNAARWRDWARSLADTRRAGGRRRGTAVIRRRNSLDLALTRRRRAVIRVNFQNHVLHRHLVAGDAASVDPTIQLAWTIGSPVERILQRASGGNRAERAPAPRQDALVQRYETRQTTFAAVTTTVRDLTERLRRVEERTGVPARLVLRGAQTELDGQARTAALQAAKLPSGEWWKDETASMRQKPAAPGFNIDQLADTVLRQLDRRVGAWRERMGRS